MLCPSVRACQKHEVFIEKHTEVGHFEFQRKRKHLGLVTILEKSLTFGVSEVKEGSRVKRAPFRYCFDENE